MATPIKIDIWSDVACPWCYIGKRRFENAAARFGADPDAPAIEVEYHSFELDPTTPADYPGTQAEYLAKHLGASPADVARMSAQVTQIAAAEGLDYQLDKVKITNTLKAHELIHFAAAHGKGAEMKERLLAAYFTQGRHVGHVEELADLAEEIGLDRTAALNALANSDYAGQVSQDIAQARQLGIRGVPFFVVDGKYGLSGAQETDLFLKALMQVSDERKGASA